MRGKTNSFVENKWIAPPGETTADVGDVLSGKTFYKAPLFELKTGTMASFNPGTVVPTTTNIVYTGGKYLAGDLTIQGDSDLVAANIKYGISIFGVTGSSQTIPTIARNITIGGLQGESSPITYDFTGIVALYEGKTILIKWNTYATDVPSAVFTLMNQPIATNSSGSLVMYCGNSGHVILSWSLSATITTTQITFTTIPAGGSVELIMSVFEVV